MGRFEKYQIIKAEKKNGVLLSCPADLYAAVNSDTEVIQEGLL